MIGGAKRILGCLSRTCNEAVGFTRDQAKLNGGISGYYAGASAFKEAFWSGMSSHVEVGKV